VTASVHAPGPRGRSDTVRRGMVVYGLIFLGLGIVGLRVRYPYAKLRVRFLGFADDDPKGERWRRYEARWVAVAGWICIVLGVLSTVVGIVTARWLPS
jgi:hypothetical protein